MLRSPALAPGVVRPFVLLPADQLPGFAGERSSTSLIPARAPRIVTSGPTANKPVAVRCTDQPKLGGHRPKICRLLQGDAVVVMRASWREYVIGTFQYTFPMVASHPCGLCEIDRAGTSTIESEYRASEP
jgi:hypothetical protein